MAGRRQAAGGMPSLCNRTEVGRFQVCLNTATFLMQNITVFSELKSYLVVRKDILQNF